MDWAAGFAMHPNTSSGAAQNTNTTSSAATQNSNSTPSQPSAEVNIPTATPKPVRIVPHHPSALSAHNAFPINPLIEHLDRSVHHQPF
jgi:hypothetical protein